jgi:hypothetical protein
MYQTIRHDILVLAVGDMNSRRRQNVKYPEEVPFLSFSRYSLLPLQLTARYHVHSSLPLDLILNEYICPTSPRSIILQWTSRCRKWPIPLFLLKLFILLSYAFYMFNTSILFDLWPEQYQMKSTICNACHAHLSIFRLILMQGRLYRQTKMGSFFLDSKDIKNLSLGGGGEGHLELQ